MMMCDMRVTIYLPDHLAQEVEAYRKARPGLSLSALVRELLERELVKRPEALLEVAGLVEKAELSAREHDALIREERGSQSGWFWTRGPSSPSSTAPTRTTRRR